MDEPDEQPTKPEYIPEPEPQLAYTIPQVAKLVGVSEWSVRTAIYDKELRARRGSRRRGYDDRPTGRIVILRADLDAWLEGLPDAYGSW